MPSTRSACFSAEMNGLGTKLSPSAAQVQVENKEWTNSPPPPLLPTLLEGSSEHTGLSFWETKAKMPGEKLGVRDLTQGHSS